jgi:HPt (histidine-containing phosphotransfer) domain-containing protein
MCLRQDMSRPSAIPDREKPAAADIIDLDHLTRMTFGEVALQAEVLSLFDRQAEMLLARIEQGPREAAAAFAHTLAGSARSVGAWVVAAAALDVELAHGNAERTAEALRQLDKAITQARAAIAALVA